MVCGIPSIKFDHGSTSSLYCLLVCVCGFCFCFCFVFFSASLVAIETDVGETISAAKVTFLCGLWSVGDVALLSAGPFFHRNTRDITVWHQRCRRSCQNEVEYNDKLP